jgi:hypothetical protein
MKTGIMNHTPTIERSAVLAAGSPQNARGKSESSLLCREYGWTLGVVDGEIPKTVLQEIRK